MVKIICSALYIRDETDLSDNSKNWEDWFEEFLIKFNEN